MKLTMPWTGSESHENGITGKLDDVRRVLSEEADHLSVVAAQIGQDVSQQAAKAGLEAGDQASTVARDVSTTANRLIQQFLQWAASIGAALAATSRRSARDLGKDVQNLGEDLRKVRITTEPKKSGPDLSSGIALVGGFGAGLALMYFADPEQGRRRRALVRDKLTTWTRIGRETASEKAKDFRNRTVGVMQEARTAIGGQTTESIETEPPSFQSEYRDDWGNTDQSAIAQESRVGVG